MILKLVIRTAGVVAVLVGAALPAFGSPVESASSYGCTKPYVRKEWCAIPHR